MRVLIVPYPGTLEIVGGHVTQQVETVRALQRAGIAASLGTVDEAVEGYHDVVHFFGDVRPLLARGRPRGRLVVSPIYFRRAFVLGPHYQRPGYLYKGVKQLRSKAAYLAHPSAKQHRRRGFRAVLAGWASADLLVVNSHAEGQLLREDAGPLPAIQVAYSGVAAEAFHGDVAMGRELVGVGDEPFVLSVARVEPRKNALAIALAVRRLPYRFVLVGDVHPANAGYLATVVRACPHLVHVPRIEHSLIRHVHAAATVHVLPSWYETTGLSTLEALAADTPAVVSGGPCVEEYFSACAELCRPESVASVRRAIVRAAASPSGRGREAARRYTWDRTATELAAAYGVALAAA